MIFKSALDLHRLRWWRLYYRRSPVRIRVRRDVGASDLAKLLVRSALLWWVITYPPMKAKLSTRLAIMFRCVCVDDFIWYPSRLNLPVQRALTPLTKHHTVIFCVTCLHLPERDGQTVAYDCSGIVYMLSIWWTHVFGASF